jgi:hypothetical protein
MPLPSHQVCVVIKNDFDIESSGKIAVGEIIVQKGRLGLLPTIMLTAMIDQAGTADPNGGDCAIKRVVFATVQDFAGDCPNSARLRSLGGWN